jgi:hypothetical protein
MFRFVYGNLRSWKERDEQMRSRDLAHATSFAAQVSHLTLEHSLRLNLILIVSIALFAMILMFNL